MHQELLERFCSQILDEVAAIIEAAEGTAHERYLRLYKLIQNREKKLGRAFNDFQRSTAIQQLILMRSMGLLTDEDLGAFSEKTQSYVRELG